MGLDFDTVVVGLGAHGSAALSALARLGVQAAGLDRFDPPHDRGSSHGETRITRLLLGEGDAYVPLVRRSHEIWRDLQASRKIEVFRQCGLLMIGSPETTAAMHGQPDFRAHAVEVARRADIELYELTPAQMAARHPNFILAPHESALFEPTGGLLFAERCIQALLADAGGRGACIFRNEHVLEISQKGETIQLKTQHRSLTAAQAILTTGPWIAELAGPAFAHQLEVRRQTLHWYRPLAPPTAAGPKPVFIWLHGATEADLFYGFPPLAPGGAQKIATEQSQFRCTPETVRREVTAAEAAALYSRHIAGRLAGLHPTATQATACLYTVAPDGNFRIGRLPHAPGIIAVSACSGHGFKHAPALGEAVAQMATTGRSDIDLAPFQADFGG